MVTIFSPDLIDFKRFNEYINGPFKGALKQFDVEYTATRSKYIGLWSQTLSRMEGFGTYTYPDGSEYKGYFKNGVFEGPGCLHLANPYDFTFKGEFSNGRLVKVDEMFFGDGLEIKAQFNDWYVHFNEWEYCSHLDRRYLKEQRNDIEPVGPTSYLTPNMPPRHVPRGYYDLEEGLYNPNNNYVWNRRLPFPQEEYVQCKFQQNFIKMHCRQNNDSISIDKIPVQQIDRILKNNIEWAKTFSLSCNSDTHGKRNKYFSHLHNEELDQLENRITSCDNTDTDTLKSSFSDENLIVDIAEDAALNVKCSY